MNRTSTCLSLQTDQSSAVWAGLWGCSTTDIELSDFWEEGEPSESSLFLGEPSLSPENTVITPILSLSNKFLKDIYI